MEKRSSLYNNKKLVYYTSGKGNVVVLIHGFGEDSSVWKNQLDALSGFQLILPDLPGSGGSDIQEDMSMEGLASAVQTILTVENVNSCTIIGHSMGGYVTLAFAERFPEQLNGFGLFHSTAYADSEEKMATRKKGIEFISKNGAAAFLKTTTANLFAPVMKEQNPELIEKQINDVSYLSDAALIAYYESMIKRPDRTNILKQTNLPVLFVLGKYDNAVPLNDGLQQTHMPRLSYIHVLEQSGHMGMMEETEKANIILNQYLTNLQKHHSP
jgi:pimeloyl-ACP methyl ester carboxylesterase